MPRHTWNHRVIRRQDEHGNVWLAIHEVHYEDDTPTLLTEDAVPVTAGIASRRGEEQTQDEALAEMRATLERMLKALDKPVLNYGDFEEGDDR